MSTGQALKTIATIGGGISSAMVLRELVGRAREVDLRGNLVLITGGSRGLGLAMARELADQGCRLVICARDADELDRASAELEQRGADVLAVRCNIADKADVDRMIETIHDAMGRVDLLICNAGVIQVGQLRNTELEDFQQAMDIMYWGVLYPILAVLPTMRDRKQGRIAVVTSIGGKISVPRLLSYSSAKFAAVGLAEGLRAELADEGITVTTLVPGLMRTGSYLNATFSGDEEGRAAQYRVFVPLSSLPLLSTSAKGAAQAFVRAIRRGEPECIHPLQFSMVARLHGLAPATTMRALRVAERLLPAGGDDDETVRGMEIDRKIDSHAWQLLTSLGRRAADTFRERPGPVSVPEPD